MPFSSPRNIEELYQRACSFSGISLGELANHLNITAPYDLKRHKGWCGMLLEYALGACAGNAAEPDFPHLGVELKTIPVDPMGVPLETTFVCSASLVGNSGITWETCYVRHKLQCVLWIPIEGSRSIPLVHRQIGPPFLWKASQLQQQQLRADWEELMDLIMLGKVEKITARHGTFLQLRPKAANSKVLTAAVGEFGQPIMTLPRGFYLKKTFTAPLLAEHFANTTSILTRS